MYQSFHVRFIFLLSCTLFLSLGCSSKTKKTECPSLAQEPVSVCRAQEKCRGTLDGPTFGVGLGAGVFPGVGMGVGAETRNANYAACLDRDLAEQKKLSEPVAPPEPVDPKMPAPKK